MTTPQQEATPDGQFVQPLPEYRPKVLQVEAPQKHWPEETDADGAGGAVVVLPGAAVGRGVGYRTVPDGAVHAGVGVGEASLGGLCPAGEDGCCVWKLQQVDPLLQTWLTMAVPPSALQMPELVHVYEQVLGGVVGVGVGAKVGTGVGVGDGREQDCVLQDWVCLVPHWFVLLCVPPPHPAEQVLQALQASGSQVDVGTGMDVGTGVAVGLGMGVGVG